MNAAPYPADTRAKGWRFELDYEQIEQSSTWALAGAEARPWLLMMWMTAWRQVPCGSLPNEPEVIAAQIGMPAKLWAKHQAVMLRGWSLADDGRLYHATVTARVVEMMGRRRSDSDRKARERMRKAAGQQPESDGITQESRVTPPGLHPESSTEYRIPNTEYLKGGGTGGAPLSPPRAVEIDTEGHQPTAAGLLCRAIKAAGVVDVNPGHPALLRLIAGGIPTETFTSTAAGLAKSGKGRFALLLKTVEGQWNDAQAAPALAAAAAAVPGASAVEATARLLREQEEAAERARSPEARAARLAAVARVKGVAA